MRFYCHLSPILLFCLIVSSCGKKDKSPTDQGKDDESLDIITAQPIINVSAIAPGEICPAGGTIIKIGWDLNNNNQLDENGDVSELKESYPVCNGANGADGENLQVITEPPGEHCVEGGLAIYDEDILITYLCHGEAGESAEQVILASEMIPGGSNSECTYGGKKLIWGIDQEPYDDILQSGEIVDTLTDCNIAPDICSASILIRSRDDLTEVSQCINIFNGDLIVDGPLSSLPGLDQLKKITGDFEIRRSQLSDFTSLRNLEEVGGSFIIDGLNTNLKSFAGLENLKTVKGALKVGAFVGPQDFTEMESIESLGELQLDNHAFIVSFAGLSRLTQLKMPALGSQVESLEGLENLVRLDIDNFRFGNGGNSLIDDLSPLSKLEYLGDLHINEGANIDNEDMVYLAMLKDIGNVYIFGGSAISDLSTISPEKLSGSFVLQGYGSMEGLRGFFKYIKHIPGDLNISDQLSLLDLTFLSRLESIGGSLTLQNNPYLDSFLGLSSLTSIGLLLPQNDDIGMNIVNGPNRMCGLTQLVNYRGVLHHIAGSTQEWSSVLLLPQPTCE